MPCGDSPSVTRLAGSWSTLRWRLKSGGAVCTALGVRILTGYVLGGTVCLVGGMILGRRNNNGDLC
jgi:hypothetical protein